jgi:hypothetical protein
VHEDKVKSEKTEERPKLMTVQGKHCPRCHRFLTKDGGNDEMLCPCGYQFCWHCTKPTSACKRRKRCVTAEGEKKLTTTYIFHQADASGKVKTMEEREEKAVAALPQKISLVERAAGHRQKRMDNRQYYRAVNALAKALATAASKDSAVADHILHVVASASSPSSRHAPQTSAESDQSAVEKSQAPAGSQQREQVTGPHQNVQQATTAFLKTAVRCKQELHEVAEYSLVLLKDVSDSVLRRRALRIAEDLGVFCSFAQSILDVWGSPTAAAACTQQDAVRAITRLAEIQTWARAALATHVFTIKKIRGAHSADH